MTKNFIFFSMRPLRYFILLLLTCHLTTSSLGFAATTPEVLIRRSFIAAKIEATSQYDFNQKFASEFQIQLPLNASEKLILTAPEFSKILLKTGFSGVRAILGMQASVSEGFKALVLSYASAMGSDLFDRWDGRRDTFTLVTGHDPRPTSETIKNLQILGYLFAAHEKNIDLKIVDMGVTTTPAIENYIRKIKAQGGVMITASHNPLEFGGFKYLTGFEEPEKNSSNERGGLLNHIKKEKIIRESHALMQEIASGNSDFIQRFNQFLEAGSWIPVFQEQHKQQEIVLNDSVANYADLIFNDVFKWNQLPEADRTRIQSKLETIPVVADTNGGSALPVLTKLNDALKSHAELPSLPMEIMTDSLGVPSRLIEPKDEALAKLLQKVNEIGAKIGIAFDYDADRGNLVIQTKEGATILHPQQVAALNVATMLAWTKTYSDLYDLKNKSVKIVSHDAGSSRIEEIAAAFGASVAYVEIGEANVVNRMHTLEKEGFFVPIGVEPYNGGTVFFGTEVRDGTLTMLASLLLLSDEKTCQTLFETLGKKTEAPYDWDNLLETLPIYFTYQKDLKEPGVSLSPVEIKKRLREKFEADFKNGIPSLPAERFNPCGFFILKQKP